MLGTSIGNYKITELIGEGGMGKVYVALHPTLERKAVVKVLHASLAGNPEVVSRFFTEAKATTAIKHPCIVEIYDYGSLPDGAPYIVMEHLEGQTLSALLKSTGVSVAEALDYAIQAAEALAAAHDKQIVHRDLKPENLFLVADERISGHRQVKILDFGIAKLQSKMDGHSHRTRTGTLMGTPQYMSPEQCLGVKEVDNRSDIYSLGVMLYEMICGRAPFESEGLGMLINMHINEAPVAPGQHRREISAALEKVMLKALAKKREDRHQSMDELLADLRAALDTIDTNAPALRAPTRTHPGARTGAPLTTLGAASTGDQRTMNGGRRRAGIIIAAGALVVGAGFVVMGGVSRPPVATNARDVSARPLASAPNMPANPVPLSSPPVVAPGPVEVLLSSEPVGATVTVDGVVVATTPSSYRASSRGEAVEFVFALDGREKEVIRAIPAAGLKLNARLRETPLAPPAVVASPRPTPRRRAPRVVDDIRSER